MPTESEPLLAKVDLANCDKEPIHIPGFIQPHGFLLAIDTLRRLTHASWNAGSLLRHLPPLGDVLELAGLIDDRTLDRPVADALASLGKQAASAFDAMEVRIDGTLYVVVVHAYGSRVIIEFEKRDPDAEDLSSFAMLAHRGMARLKGRSDVRAILAEPVMVVRQLRIGQSVAAEAPGRRALITGQNPASATLVGQAIVHALGAQR
jgi:light-regulated signal transduction histidine kinase (bacteriophytochrome)